MRKPPRRSSATPVAKPPPKFTQSLNRSSNPFIQREIRAARQETINELALFVEQHPDHLPPGVVAAACGVDRATIRKAVLAGDITEARHTLPGGRVLVLVSLADVARVFA